MFPIIGRDAAPFHGRDATPAALGEQGPRVHRAARRRVHAIVKVERGALGIAGVAHVSEDVALPHDVAGFERAETVEVRVVVDVQPRAEHRDDLPAEPSGSDAKDEAVRGAPHRCSPRREDVDALVLAAAASRPSPRVRDLPGPNAIHRHRQG
jgi:hypothetical protein